MEPSASGSPPAHLKVEEPPKEAKKRKVNKKLLGVRENVTPVLPANSLSVVEQFFFKIPSNRPQVIVGGAMRLRCPKSVKHFSVARVVDILKACAAQHHRLSSYVDPKDATTHTLAKTADKLSLNIKVTPRTTQRKLQNILNENVNTNFDLNDTSKPLWRCVVLVPESSFQEIENVATSDYQALRNYLEDDFMGEPKGIGSLEIAKFEDYKDNDGIFWEFVFAFNHCLGDGLSVYAFSKTIFDMMTSDAMTAETYDISKIGVNQGPPPMLDNLLQPPFWQVFPVAISFLSRYFVGYSSNRFHGSPRNQLTDTIPLTNATNPSEQVMKVSNPERTLSIQEFSLAEKPTTSILLFNYSGDFVAQLRDKCRERGTNVTGVMVVAALAAVRTTFGDSAMYESKKMPAHQGFVLTTSFRHLVPGSRLLDGGDKQTDPATEIFSGYGGGAMISSFKCVDDQDIFERAKKVRGKIASSFIQSLGRAMLVNYIYRKPKLWKWINGRNKKVQKLVNRSFSVELANLGIWDLHTAAPDASDEDPRLRLFNFWGSANCSFDGARALFTIGTVTLGKDMSMAIAYDKSVINENDAEVFVRVFDAALRKAAAASGKLTIAEARKLPGANDA